MRRYVVLAPLLVLMVTGLCLIRFGHQSESTDEESRANAGNQLGGFVIGGPIQYANLTIFPVISKTARNADRFITLDEGLKAGTIEIFEVGADGRRIVREEAVGDNSDQQQASTQAAESQAEQEIQAWKQIFTSRLRVLISLGPQGPLLTDVGARLLEEAQNASDDGDEEDDGEVNQLQVRNTSGKALYLMPGEVIVGGYQDRTIAEETIIASSDKAVPLDVFCVEQGRWASRDVEGTSVTLRGLMELNDADTGVFDNSTTLSLIIRETSVQATRGQFVASAGSLSKASRLAVQDEADQDRVWERVAQANTSLQPGTREPSVLRSALEEQLASSSVDIGGVTVAGLATRNGFSSSPSHVIIQGGSGANFGQLINIIREGTSGPWDEGVSESELYLSLPNIGMSSPESIDSQNETDTFTANYADADVRKKLKPYLGALRERVSKRSRVVGVIVAVNGKVEAADVFESTPLFLKLWPKLLKSYALDAAAQSTSHDAGKQCRIAKARMFLSKAMASSEISKKKTTGGLMVTKRASGDVVSFSAGGGAGGFDGAGDGFGGGVHSAAFSK